MASEPWIANASPLILLGKAGLTDLLVRLAGTVLVPAAVSGEISAGPDGGRIVEILKREKRVHFHPSVSPPPALAAWDLEPGETQVIALADSFPACRVVLDDLQARRCARARGLKIIGTLGLVGRAKRLGLIAEARPHVQALLRAGLYATDEIIEQILREVGE